MTEYIGLQVRRILIAILGTTVLALGLILVPYPGPGWLIVFVGLAILGSEFMWAKGILRRGRSAYEAWKLWLKIQPLEIRLLVLAMTALVTVATIWLLNGYGFINDWLNLGINWLNSPLDFF